MGTNEGHKMRVKVHPFRIYRDLPSDIYTAGGEHITQTDLDRLYRRLELAEYFMEQVKIDDSDFPLFMEWLQLKEENYAEFIYMHVENIPTGEYFKDEQAL